MSKLRHGGARKYYEDFRTRLAHVQIYEVPIHVKEEIEQWIALHAAFIQAFDTVRGERRSLA
jgi:hypothetical protein